MIFARAFATFETTTCDISLCGFWYYLQGLTSSRKRWFSLQHICSTYARPQCHRPGEHASVSRILCCSLRRKSSTSLDLFQCEIHLKRLLSVSWSISKCATSEEQNLFLIKTNSSKWATSEHSHNTWSKVRLSDSWGFWDYYTLSSTVCTLSYEESIENHYDTLTQHLRIRLAEDYSDINTEPDRTTRTRTKYI